MSDSIVLRKIYALDSNTGLFISSGKVLTTNGVGGTVWVDMFSTLTDIGGDVMIGLPSSISTFSSLTQANASTISTNFYNITQAICSIGAIADATGANIQTATLGSLGYMSTASVSTFVGQVVSTACHSDSTIYTLGAPLSTFQYANSSTISTLKGGMNDALFSTVVGLSNIGYILLNQLQSTVGGLGSLGYISSINAPITFQSTVGGLGSIGYVSTSQLLNVINTMGNQYVSTASLASTVSGLSTFGYPTNIDLSTAVLGVSAMKNSIRFDTVGNVYMSGTSNIVNFTNPGNVIFVSTFYQSTMYYDGAPVGSPILGKMVTPNSMEFSTAKIRFDAFSSFINSNSKVTLDIYPTYAFSKLGTGATQTAILTISTMLKSGNILLSNTIATNSLFVANTQVRLENGSIIDSSNIYSQPIKISIPPRVWDFTNPYTLYHFMPNSVQFGALQNALHDATITPYFGSTGSIFVSIQNSI